MKHEIIKTDNYLLVVDDSEIIEGDYRVNIQRGYIQLVDDDPEYYNKRNDVFKKVIAHLPLNNSPILRDIDLLPPLPSEEDGVDKLALTIFPRHENWTLNSDNADKRPIWIDGYNKAKETHKYTEEDMRKAMVLYSAWITGGTPSLRVAETAEERQEQIIQSLSQPEMPIGFECEMKFKQIPDFHKDEPKTTTNSQGQSVWVGKYIYAQINNHEQGRTNAFRCH